MAEKSRNLPALVISGLPVSGKSTLAKMLSEEYGLEVYSMGQLWRERWKKLHPNADISFEAFWAKTTVADNRKMNMQAKSLFESGDVIVDSRYTSYLSPKKCLRIFVTADLEVRAERAAANRPDYKGKNQREIKSILRGRENDELRMGKQIFGIDYRNPELHHVVLNSGMLTPEQEFRIVQTLRKLRQKEPQLNLRSG